MRQHDEDMIDFPVADVWRDHYAAQGLTYPSGRREHAQASLARLVATACEPVGPPPAAASTSSHLNTLGDLLTIIRQQQAEINKLKAERHPPTNSRDSFEGVE